MISKIQKSEAIIEVLYAYLWNIFEYENGKFIYNNQDIAFNNRQEQDLFNSENISLIFVNWSCLQISMVSFSMVLNCNRYKRKKNFYRSHIPSQTLLQTWSPQSLESSFRAFLVSQIYRRYILYAKSKSSQFCLWVTWFDHFWFKHLSDPGSAVLMI